MIKLAKISSIYRGGLIVKTYRGWLKKNEKVLDVGCGNGVITLYLANKLNLNIYGCDIQKYLIRKIPFKKMQSESKLPFPNKSFDAVMLNDVLHHTSPQNQIKLLKECARVSNKILIFELKPSLIGGFCDYLINKIHNPRMSIPYTYRSKKNWLSIFKKIRLRVKSKEVRGAFWYPFSHLAFCLEVSKQT